MFFYFKISCHLYKHEQHTACTTTAATNVSQHIKLWWTWDILLALTYDSSRTLDTWISVWGYLLLLLLDQNILTSLIICFMTSLSPVIFLTTLSNSAASATGRTASQYSSWWSDPISLHTDSLDFLLSSAQSWRCINHCQIALHYQIYW